MVRDQMQKQIQGSSCLLLIYIIKEIFQKKNKLEEWHCSILLQKLFFIKKMLFMLPSNGLLISILKKLMFKIQFSFL